MKKSFLTLLLATQLSHAQLPQIADDDRTWLGYFIGYSERYYDFGIGSDGEHYLYAKKGRKRASTKEITIRYIIAEKIDGRWVRRKLKSTGGLESPNEKGLNPEQPVTVTTTVTGGTKVEWTYQDVKGKMIMTPKLIEKTTENEIKIGVSFRFPSLHKFDNPIDKQELKKKFGKDIIRGIRYKDGKTVKLKLADPKANAASEDAFKEGAIEFEFDSQSFMKRSVTVQAGPKKSGVLLIAKDRPINESITLDWMVDMEKIGTPGAHVTFWVE